MEYANLSVLWARRLAGTRCRVILREANTISRISKANVGLKWMLIPHLMRVCYHWADGIIAVSNGVADDLARRVRVSRDAIEVIYNPVPTAEIVARANDDPDMPWLSPGEPPVIVGLGRLDLRRTSRLC